MVSDHIPDSKVYRANIGPIWVLSAPDGPREPGYQGEQASRCVAGRPLAVLTGLADADDVTRSEKKIQTWRSILKSHALKITQFRCN